MSNKKTIWVFYGVLLASVAMGRFTTINDATSGSEPSLYKVLDVVAPVSGGWTSNAALNTGANGLRIDDNDDQIWQGPVKVTVLTSFWGGKATPYDSGSQFFRYDDNLDGTSPATGFSINDGAFIIGDGGGAFGAWSSEALNGGTDRAVTFDVTGLDVYAWVDGTGQNPATTLVASSTQLPAYLVAFEAGSDGDYQDMVVLIQAVRLVPAPGAIVLVCSGLYLAGWLKRKRVLK